MPPIFGLIADTIDVSLLPIYLAALLILMFIMNEKTVRKYTKKESLI